MDETGSNRLYAFPHVTNMSAREFKEKPVEEADTEPLYVYEVTDRTAIPNQPFFDVFQRYQEKTELTKFKHLQPCSLKPYGTEQKDFLVSNRQKKLKIVYPSGSSGIEENIHYKHSSTRKKNSDCGDTKKAPVYKTSSTKMISKNYSTVAKSTKQQLTRNLSNSLQNKQRQRNSDEFERFFKKTTNAMLDYKKRNFNTLDTTSKCNEYVTVKLGELQEQCRKEKKCKPKKIKFQLSKLRPSDCECIEDLPLKQGPPLHRLKKRFEVKEKERIDCTEVKECQNVPRADDGYQIRKKQLPTIKVMDCPCEEREMTDFVIKRLPKKKLVDPPKKICYEDPCADTPRADKDYKIKIKPLPKIRSKHCPQICPDPMLDVPLHR